MSQHAAKLLEACLIASGADPDQARRAVAVVLPAAVAAEIIPRRHLECWETAASCYNLRNVIRPSMSIAEVAERFGLGKRWVIVQTARHGKRVRAGLKSSGVPLG